MGKLQLAVRCSGMEDQETGRLNLLFYSVCFLKSNDQIYFLHEMCVKIRNYLASLLAVVVFPLSLLKEILIRYCLS